MDKCMMVNGESLAALLAPRYITIAELSQAVGIDRQSVALHLKPGVRGMRKNNFRLYAQFLNMEPRELERRICAAEARPATLTIERELADELTARAGRCGGNVSAVLRCLLKKRKVVG